MLKRVYKYWDVATTVYCLLAMIEIVIEFIKVKVSTTIITIFGLRLTTDISENGVFADFTFDKNFFIQYFIFISVVLLLTYILPLKRK